jgi:polar amino acid transport system ATP-binding protein/sulfate transport system ATP-binding protein
MSEENTLLIISHDIASILTVADHLWLLGRVRTEDGRPNGARIVQTYDLIERGLAWQEKPQDLPVYVDLQREVRARFDTL